LIEEEKKAAKQKLSSTENLMEAMEQPAEESGEPAPT